MATQADDRSNILRFERRSTDTETLRARIESMIEDYLEVVELLIRHLDEEDCAETGRHAR